MYRFEKNLEKRKAYKFKLPENLSDPTDLSNVVILPGYEGEYNQAVKKNAMRLSLIFFGDGEEPRVSIDFKGHIYDLKEGDFIDGGVIRKINKNSVEYEKDGKIKTLMPGQK